MQIVRKPVFLMLVMLILYHSTMKPTFSLLGLLGFWSYFFPFYSFSQNYNLLRDARYLGGDCYQLTANTVAQTGVVWYQDKLNLNESFSIEFEMNFGIFDDTGADGMMFILQTVGNNAIGGAGQSLGFEGFSPSLGVEFDTWQNTDNFDPTYDHIAIVQNGSVVHNGISTLAGPVQASSSNVNIEDGQNHRVRIKWNVKTKEMEIYFDCKLRLTLKKDIVNDIFKGQNTVWWGFSGSTGGSFNEQTVCLKKEIVAKNLFSNVCQTEGVQLVSREAADGKYEWSPSTGLNNTSIRAPFAKPTQTLTYTVKYKDACLLPVEDTIRVEVLPPPVVSIKSLEVLCSLNPIQLVPSVKNDVGAVSYRWSTNETTPSINVNQAGNYTVTVSNPACQVSKLVEVRSERPNLLPDTTLCLNLQAITLSAGENNLNYTYRWSPTGENTPNITVSSPGNYKILVSTPLGCAKERNVVIYEIPQITTDLEKVLCEGSQVTLSPTVTGRGTYSYVWSNGATGNSITVKTAGTYTLNVAQDRCKNSVSINVTQRPYPSILRDEVACFDRPLVAGVLDNGLQYYWTHSGERTRAVSVSAVGTYAVQISNIYGCAKTRKFNVTGPCNPQVYAPTIFTPNKDNVNDTFQISMDGGQILGLAIYNRWGELLYYQTSAVPQWDGKTKDNDCPDGAYPYVLYYKTTRDNSVQEYKGVIAIRR